MVCVLKLKFTVNNIVFFCHSFDMHILYIDRDLTKLRFLEKNIKKHYVLLMINRPQLATFVMHRITKNDF
jgi:hypothetical protein